MRKIGIVPSACVAGASIATAFASRPAAVALSTALGASGPTKLLRMPTLSATQIAFAYANDIWTVDRAGRRERVGRCPFADLMI